MGTGNRVREIEAKVERVLEDLVADLVSDFRAVQSEDCWSDRSRAKLYEGLVGSFVQRLKRASFYRVLDAIEARMKRGSND